MAAPTVARAVVAAGDDLDALARAAAEAVDVPIGLVTFVDGEWMRFVGAYGLVGPLASARRILVSESFCQDVVARSAPVIMRDTADDPRSRPTGAAVRVGAYLGVPLRAADGPTVGVLCAVDSRARDWTPEEISALRGVAIAAGYLPGLLDAVTPDDARVDGSLHAPAQGASPVADPEPGEGPHSLFLQALLDSLDTAVFACDAAGCTMFGNQALLRMFDLDHDLPANAADLAGDRLCDADGRPLARDATRPSARSPVSRSGTWSCAWSAPDALRGR